MKVYKLNFLRDSFSYPYIMKTQTIMKEMTLLLPAVLNRNQKVISLDF